MSLTPQQMAQINQAADAASNGQPYSLTFPAGVNTADVSSYFQTALQNANPGAQLSFADATGMPITGTQPTAPTQDIINPATGKPYPKLSDFNNGLASTKTDALTGAYIPDWLKSYHSLTDWSVQRIVVVLVGILFLAAGIFAISRNSGD